MPNEKYYAVAKGRTPGIYMKWENCEAQVKGYSGGVYKKFDTVQDAKDYVVTGGSAGGGAGSSSQGQSGGSGGHGYGYSKK